MSYDFTWVSSDSSRQRDDFSLSTMQSTSQRQSPQQLKGSKTSGLLAINDFDFETLIEILGTNEADNRKKPTSGHPYAQQDTSENLQGEALASDLVSRSLDSSCPIPQESRNKMVSITPDMPLLVPEDASPSNSPQSVTKTDVTRDVTPPKRTGRMQDEQAPRPSDRQAFAIPSKPMAIEKGRKETQLIPIQRVRPGFGQLSKELGIAVTETRGRVSELRSHIQSLKEEVKELAPHLYHRAFESQSNQNEARRRKPNRARGVEEESKHSLSNVNHDDNASQLDEQDTIIATKRDVIATLTEEETRRGLANICEILDIDPTRLIQQTRNVENRGGEMTNVPPDLDHVLRSIKLVQELDELVWKRSRFGIGEEHRTGQSSSEIFNEENIQSILDHVRLWERTARSRTKRTYSTT